MTLPSSGQISFNDLRVELGISTQAPFSITTAATNGYVTINTNSPSYPNVSAPHAISEWYGYNHNAPVCNPLNGGNNFRYNNSTPGDPQDCSDYVSDYPSTGPFYSTDCSTFAAGCTIYANSGCTTLAYNAGVRYINDSSDYYTLNASSVAVYGAICNT